MKYIPDFVLLILIVALISTPGLLTGYVVWHLITGW